MVKVHYCPQCTQNVNSFPMKCHVGRLFFTRCFCLYFFAVAVCFYSEKRRQEVGTVASFQFLDTFVFISPAETDVVVAGWQGRHGRFRGVVYLCGR